MLTVAATGIKDFTLSDDGRTATFALVTKHSGDLEITLPTSALNVFRSSQSSTRQVTNGAPAKGGGDVTVSVPKKWAVAVDQQRGLVIMVLDPQMPTQSGLAFTPGAAQELGTALMKQANTTLSKN